MDDDIIPPKRSFRMMVTVREVRKGQPLPDIDDVRRAIREGERESLDEAFQRLRPQYEAGICYLSRR